MYGKLVCLPECVLPKEYIFECLKQIFKAMHNLAKLYLRKYFDSYRFKPTCQKHKILK